jgi:molecular chaperone Hsp33
VQTKGDGPLNLLATDYRGSGGLRGYARLDEDRYAREKAPSGFGALIGSGALAITIEPKAGGQTYQGLVPLAADGLAASAETYFRQSEQLPTMLKLAAGPIYRSGAGKGWRAGGVMVQALPGHPPGEVEASDDWKRIGLFLQSLADVELLDTGLKAEDVLWRLFHEDEVRVHPSEALHFECGCQPDRIAAVLKTYPKSELEDLPDPDGIIRTRCEFCGVVYEFPPETLSA